MAAKYDLKVTRGGNFTFNLKAGNGQVVLTSQRYKAKTAASNGIESARKNSTNDGRYDRRTAKNGAPYFVLKAANGQIIGQSQRYGSSSAMENGINSVKANAADARVDDQT